MVEYKQLRERVRTMSKTSLNERPVLEQIAQEVGSWKGYDQGTPTDRTIELAQHWICSLYCETSESHKPWLQPAISATEEGDIAFEWWRDGRRLTVYVNEESGVTYTKLWGSRPNLLVEDGNTDSKSDRRDMWSWIIG